MIKWSQSWTEAYMWSIFRVQLQVWGVSELISIRQRALGISRMLVAMNRSWLMRRKQITKIKTSKIFLEVWIRFFKSWHLHSEVAAYLLGSSVLLELQNKKPYTSFPRPQLQQLQHIFTIQSHLHCILNFPPNHFITKWVDHMVESFTKRGGARR